MPVKFYGLSLNLWLTIIGLAGLVPVGLLLFWTVALNAESIESEFVTQYDMCAPTISDCSIPQQCRINVENIKRYYIEELEGPAGPFYKWAGYPKLDIGYPQGRADRFTIPLCNQ